MKSRLIDAAAFLIGVIAAFMQGGAGGDFAWPIRLALSLMGPGYYAGLPLFYLVGAIGLESVGFFFLVGILANGLIFGLVSYLIQKAKNGQRAARIALTIGMAAWITWGAGYAISSLPRAEHHAPVDLSSPLAGHWKGVLHSPRGDRSMVLVCHPRADGSLDGYIYIRGWDQGEFENGVYSRDSLHFEIVGFDYRAHFDHTKMTMVIMASRLSQSAELRFANADTTRPGHAPVDLASPLAGRWVRSGEGPIVLICHPHTDQVLDGYLYIAGKDMGPFDEGVWSSDSLHFDIDGFRYSAHFDRTTMAMERSGKGMNQSIALKFAGADTTGR